MFSQSCAAPCYCLNEAINDRTEPQLLSPKSWFLSFLVNGQRKRARKKTEKQPIWSLLLLNGFQWTAVCDEKKKKPLGTSCATAYSQVTHPIESRSNIIPCFCTQSSVISVGCSLYCCVFVNSCRFIYRGKKKNQKGVKVVDLPSVHFLDLFGPQNEVQKQIYTRCKISF